jgi:hypothetical protein
MMSIYNPKLSDGGIVPIPTSHKELLENLYQERLEAECLEREYKDSVIELARQGRKTDKESPVTGPVYPPAAAAVLNEYPQFAKDLLLLKRNKVITDTETGYKWEKSKASLSEYFGNMRHKPTPWKMIENLFNETGLKNSFSSNGGSYGKKKSSADYLEIQKILENTSES